MSSPGIDLKNNSVLDSFLCWYCEKNLSNLRYVIKDGFAICLTCFEEKYANRCIKCEQTIGIEMQGSTFNDKSWHNTCFNCTICHTSLIKMKFAYRNEQLYCERCFIIEFAVRCHRCNRPLEPGVKCTNYNGQLYHKTCFVCNACQQPLSDLNFRRRDKFYLCLKCHLRLVAIRCIKCQKAIVYNGVLYHNHPFHHECFTCTHCNIALSNSRFIENNGETFCSTCSTLLK